MHLKNTHLVHFRNFPRLELAFSPSVNVFIGDNGQGKTNLLEGISCLFTGSSFRTSDDHNLVQWGEDGFYLGGEVERLHRSTRIELSFDKQGGKVSIMNGKRSPVVSRGSLSSLTVFASQDVRVIEGGPHYRRNFVDQTCAALVPGFSGLRSKYYRVLAQRNALLATRTGQKKQVKGASLEAWDEQYIEAGAKLMIYRLQVLSQLAGHLGAIIQQIREGVQELQLVYKCSFLSTMGSRLSHSSVADALRTKITALRGEELQRGTSLVGPHRDDFRILVNGIDQRYFGSHGQQKVLAVALKLAHVMLMREKLEEWPVVLLDDAFSDFDRGRQERLVGVLTDRGQLFVTAQSAAQLPATIRSGACTYRVQGGHVRQQDG